MKIVCESCGAKYSIADEKVAGKVFKIRCKRCSEVIMVRGDQQPDTAQADVVHQPAGEAIWHVVVNGEQQGPFAPGQLGEMLTAGTVDWDAYVWTEGFENWVPMRDVEHLVAQITGSDQSASQQQTTATGGFHAAASPQAAPASDAYTAQPSMGADPFADPPMGTIDQAGPDLFGDAAASAPAAQAFAAPAVQASPMAAVAAAPMASAAVQEPAMTGTRNENSVLFSLKNLQALATGSSTPSAAPPTAGAAAGFASGEGSGLIDIRALASATGIGDGSRENSGDKDELLAMGGQGAAFGALGSPMLAAPSEDREGGNRTLILAAIIGGSVVMAGGLVAFAMLRQPEAAPPPPEVGVAAVPPTPVAPTPAPAAAAPTPEPPSEGELAAKAAAQEDSKESASDRGSSSDDRHRRHGSSKKDHTGSAPKEPAKVAAADPTPEPLPKPKPRGGSASLDELLEGALTGGGKQRAKTAAPKAQDNLPEKPSRSDVVNAMKGVSGAVSACGKGASGVAFANVNVSGSTGRVKSVQVEGQTGAVGSCIARAVRKARFPKFKSSSFQVKYPFRL